MVGFVMLVCPSVCMKQLVSHWTNLSIFWISFKKFWVSLKPGKSNRYFTWRSMSFCLFFLEWEMLQTKVVEKIKTFYVQWFFSKTLWENVENMLGHRWLRKMLHALWMVSNCLCVYTALFRLSAGRSCSCCCQDHKDILGKEPRWGKIRMHQVLWMCCFSFDGLQHSGYIPFSKASRSSLGLPQSSV